jgi:hypothetical protein
MYEEVQQSDSFLLESVVSCMIETKRHISSGVRCRRNMIYKMPDVHLESEVLDGRL